jgi:hypothetical protein
VTDVPIKHIIIDIPAVIWPEMKAEYERLSGKRSVTLVRYRSLPLVEFVVGNDGKIQGVTAFCACRGSCLI